MAQTLDLNWHASNTAVVARWNGVLGRDSARPLKAEAFILRVQAQVRQSLHETLQLAQQERRRDPEVHERPADREVALDVVDAFAQLRERPADRLLGFDDRRRHRLVIVVRWLVRREREAEHRRDPVGHEHIPRRG